MKKITSPLTIFLLLITLSVFSQEDERLIKEINSFEEARQERVRTYLDNHLSYRADRFRVLVDVINGRPIPLKTTI
jgi:hypothetical protein